MGTSIDELPEMLRLRHPEFAGLQFGADPDEAIKFGARGGMPAFEALVRADHPLLPGLLAAHPEIEVVQPGPAKTWACILHPDREFSTKAALRAHMRGAGHDAADILEAIGGGPVDPTAGATDVAPDTHVSGDGVIMQDPPVPPKQPLRPGFGPR